MGCLKIRQVGLSFILLCAFGPFSGQAIAQVAQAVPTFHAIGIYYSSSDGDESNACGVEYKIAEEETWQAGLDLWYDVRNNEYRGSLVNLVPGLTYQIKISCDNPAQQEILTATTWQEQFAVGSTVYLPAGTTNSTVLVNDSGTADAYVLYTHPAGAETVIDVDDAQDHCLEISASYVIIRGLTLKNAGIHGIKLLPGVHDVIIENCDISGWGRLDTLKNGDPDPYGFGVNEDAGIYSNSADIQKIIIQRNKIHHPRYDSNSWKEYREKYEGTKQDPWHPSGPKAITLKASGGNHVIRYNEIFSDDEHYFNDCIGEAKNFGIGFPHADTDIYGNYLERSWDDAIESEGYNRNVRIWGNYIDRSYVGIATVPVHDGPLYIWKNVIYSSRKGPAPEHNYGGPLFKVGGNTVGEYYGDGKLYIFHNTSLMPPPDSGLAGHSTQINADTRTLRNCVSRNNILQSASDGHYAIYNVAMNPENDFDFDLYNGLIYWGAGVFEQHGQNDKPVYVNDWGFDRDAGTGIFFSQKDWSPGYDAGQVIANFNDDYSGPAPDMGAHEAGTPMMEFGVQASYLNPRGLIGYWPFDESVGSTVALDKSGLGNRGNLYGEVTRVDGKTGHALQFNGNNGYVEIVDSDHSPLDVPRDLSISLWIKRTASTPGDEYFVAKNGSFLWKISNDIPYFIIYTTEAHVIAPAPLAVDQWQHLSAVYDYTQQEVRIYLDGQLSVTQAVSGTIEMTNGSLFLGHPSNACLNGLLDDVRIYNRILTEDEIRLQAGIITENVLAGHWSLDDGSGVVFSDSSGSDNHGALYGDTSWSIGRTGPALKFDGDADYGLIPDGSGSLALDQDFSISLWLYVNHNTGGDEWFLWKGASIGWKLSNLTPFLFTWNSDLDLQLVDAPQLTLQQWHHLVATYDSASKAIIIYIDGQAGVPLTISGDLNVTPDDLMLGHSSAACLDGKIDEITIYNSVLGPQEVNDLLIPPDLPGDLNADGVVDRADVRIIIDYRNQSADACLACDLDEDGTITVSDARKGVLLCTCPRCTCP
ncbi:hypothetical protein D1BOALGB6SA_1305 [Olavius sp. associated proteobacterium Delta 1]|nr:hypothetical protein D1BOALGB6SA_1305 [Olavius sp. associated proteobacterium Delta 1]